MTDRDKKVLAGLLEPVRAFARKHKLKVEITIELSDEQQAWRMKAYEPPEGEEEELTAPHPDDIFTLRKLGQG